MRLSLLIVLLLIGVQSVFAQTAQPNALTHVSALDFSPDGKQLAVGIGTSELGGCASNDFPIAIYDTVSMQQIAELTEHWCTVTSVEYDSSGTQLASSSLDTNTGIWNLDMWQMEGGLIYGREVLDTLWSSDGSSLLVVGSTSSRIFYPSDWQQEGKGFILRYASDESTPITTTTWNRLTHQIAHGAGDGGIYIWNETTGDLLSNLSGHSAEVRSLDWNTTDNLIASGDADGVIKVWNGVTGDEITSFTAHTGAVHDLEWSADGRVLVSAGDDGFVRVWFIENSGISMVAEFEYGAAVYAVALNPDTTKIAYGGAGINGQNGEVAIADLNFVLPTATPAQHQSHITSLAWNSTGTVFAVTYSTPKDESCYSDPDLYSIRLFNADLTPYQVLRSGILCRVNSAIFNPAGTELISVDDTGDNYLWDVNSGEIIFRVTGFISWEKVVWRPTSTDFALMNDDGVGLWVSLTEGINGLIASNVGFTGKMTDIDWNPDGQFIVAGNEDGTARIWDVSEDNKITQVFQEHTNPIASVAWNRVANSQVVASGDTSGTINIWNAETGERITTITAHTGAVHDLEWSADGRMFASAGDDGFVRVWHIENDAISMLAEFEYGAAVYAVALNPDATKIAYGGAGINRQDGEVAIADLNLDGK